ncbi:MFS transporter [Paenibacillus sp. 598K]|uniref:MFS transporter n=1 Tax=Paenibacillus sp. 598K TaxID=1117987 RepID=UPI000FFA5695|nr:MFS transporter [Paenibacillus sp. 598K]GBF76757.1 MFS transporter [Paenibacillus sp. 598K]
MIPTKYSVHLYVAFFYMTHASFSPFLGFWFSEQGLSSRQIGLLFSIGPLVGLLVQPLWGIVCDRFGIERRVLAISLLAAPLLAFGYVLADGVFALFILTAVVYAVFYSSLMPITDAITVSHAREHGQSYGGIRFLGSLSFALLITPFGLLYDRFGIDTMFVMQLIAMLAAALMLLQVKRPSVSLRRPGRMFSGLGQLLRQPSFGWFLLFVFVVSIGNHFYNVFFSVFIGRQGGQAAEQIGWLNSISALSELPFFLLSGLLIRRWGYYPILCATALAGALRWWSLSLEPTFAVLMTSQLLHGMTFALFMAAGINYAFERSPEGMKNTGQTVFALVYMNLANIVASNGGGWLLDQYGFPVLYRTGALLALSGAAGFVLLALHVRRRG